MKFKHLAISLYFVGGAIVSCGGNRSGVILSKNQYEDVVDNYGKFDPARKEKAVNEIYSYYQLSHDGRALVFLKNLQEHGDPAAVKLFQLVDRLDRGQ